MLFSIAMAPGDAREGGGNNGWPPYNASLIREELAAICASEGFADSERLRQFLTFVVDSSLNGLSGQLKESVIGVEVYRREATYSPKADPIVRTEARRLRTKLSAFYGGQGAGHRVVISLPTGGYVPHFELRGTDELQPVDPVSPPAIAAEKPPSVPLPRNRRSLLYGSFGIAVPVLLILLMAKERWLSRTAFVYEHSGVHRSPSLRGPPAGLSG
ncbi:MAG: hypothetical protein ABSD75_26090 [Terriglobales bacterium]|jgi:hypothetical protein